MFGSFRPIVSLALSLTLAACEGGIELKTVGGIPGSPAPVKIQAGTKFVLEKGDDPTQDAYPFILLLDPQKICDDLTFYNQDGDLVKGARSCEVPALGQYEPNLKAENIKAGISIGSIEGILKPSPRDCEADGEADCVAVSPMYAAGLTTGAAAKILTGQTLAGVSGSATAAPSNCASDGQTDCVAITTYPALQKSLLTASVLKSGTVINGVTGAYPNTTYPLASNTAATDLTTFVSQVTTDGGFEFFDSAGVRYTGSGDSDLFAANIRSGTAIESLSITGTMPAILPASPTPLTTLFATGPNRMILNWSNTGAAGYLVVVRTGAAVSFTPSRTVTYTAGTQGSNEIIYAGTATTFTHSGLSAGTVYYYSVFAYDANRFYSAVAATAVNTSAFCTGLAGGTWVGVPGDATYGTSDFCVMKYEPKNVSGVATSQAALTPWGSMDQTTAQTKCQDLGANYQLISNNEWLTIGANIAAIGSNWSTGTVGSGELNRGHSDNNPASSCAASTDDSLAFVETDCTFKNSSGDDWNQKRTHTLSTGDVIWDLAGNVSEWTSYTLSSNTAKPFVSSVGAPDSNWRDFYFLNSNLSILTLRELLPRNAQKTFWNDAWNATNGIGQYYAGSSGSGGALRRGPLFQETCRLTKISFKLGEQEETSGKVFTRVQRSHRIEDCKSA